MNTQKANERTLLPYRCGKCGSTSHATYMHDNSIPAKEIEGWLPIQTAPKTGEHILAGILDGGVGFGICGGKHQPNCDVVHWWDVPGEEGFYPSNGPDEIYPATHWKPL